MENLSYSKDSAVWSNKFKLSVYVQGRWLPAETEYLDEYLSENLSVVIDSVYVYRSRLQDGESNARAGAIAVGIGGLALAACSLHTAAPKMNADSSDDEDDYGPNLLRTIGAVAGLSLVVAGVTAAVTTEEIVYHMFTVLELRNRKWISMEKNKSGIIIQVAPRKELVLEMIEGKNRGECSLLVDTRCRRDRNTLKHVIDWLYETKQLSQNYDLMTSNCKHFARELFNNLHDGKHIPSYIERIFKYAEQKTE